MAAAFVHTDVAAMSAERIGEALAASFLALEAALTPVLGRRGVGALYKRSLHLLAAPHPWLPVVDEDVLAAMDLAPLKQAIAHQSGADAALAAADLLRTFRELLVGLVGASLTERLLRSVAPPFSNVPPGQEPPP